MTNTPNQIETIREKYQKTYVTARNNLLLAVVLTLISLVLVATLGFYLTFSAYLPTNMVATGKDAMDIDNGVYTAEELGITEEELAAYQEVTDGTFELVLSIIPAVLIVGFYFLCWALSKKHFAWMIAALALYILDTLLMIPDLLSYYLPYDITGALFLAFYHAWVLYYLITGVIASVKLKKLPLPIEGEAVEVSVTEGGEASAADNADNNLIADEKETGETWNEQK